MRSNCRTDRGFTLIELLVAFTIVSLIVVATFSGLNIALSSWSRGNDALRRVRVEDMNLDLIREQLRSALPFVRNVEGAGTSLAFVATDRRIDFVSAYSIPDGPGASPRWVTISWEPGPSDGTILLGEHRILSPENRPEADPYWSASLALAESVRFRFFRRDEPGQPGQWFTSWNSPQNLLPEAVAILLNGEDGGTKRIVIPMDSAPSRRLGGWLE